MARQPASGKKRTTQQDIVNDTGLSPRTVSVALRGGRDISQATIDRVRKSAKKLRYKPRGMRRRTIGLTIPNLRYISYYASFVGCLREQAAERDMTVLIGETGGDPAIERRLIDEFCQHATDGLILVSPRVPIAELDSIARRDQPIVTAFSLPGESVDQIASIEIDNHAGAKDAITHLLTRGHRHIAYLAGRPLSASNHARRQGYSEALQSAGSEVLETMIVEMSHLWPTFQAGYEQCGELLGRNISVDAIFAYNDMMAFGAMRALREHRRRIPADVSVVGFDNLDLCMYSDPPLASVGVELQDVAARVVDLLGQLIAKSETVALYRHQVIPAHFIGRESIGRRESP